MDTSKLTRFVNQVWDDSVVHSITEYIKIPNKSPAFDKDWEKHGYMADAVKLMEKWAREKLTAFPGAKLEVVQLPGRTPLIFMDIPGDSKDTVLLYGHLDKQPEMVGWEEGLGPWTPVRKGDRLFGRGSADDGYAIYASLTSLLALKDQGVQRARCVVLIEACEESGSGDLPHYVDHLAARIGDVSLVVCLDSGCGNYDQLWLTTSLRGIAMGNLTVRVLTEGVHSGDGSGLIPSSFRIARQLLSRVEDEKTGEIKLQDMYVQVPPKRIEQAKQAAEILGDAVYSKMPLAGRTKPVTNDLTELVLNRTWRPQLAVTGMEGYPLPVNAGNVALPYSTLKLSFRLPPTLDAEKTTKLIKDTLESDPPYDAEVEFDAEEGQSGWNAPALTPWLEKSVNDSSLMAYGKPAAHMGEGGTIPFMGMLGAKFPKTQFVVTGVLGPHSNAHGPNEFLDIPMAKKVTMCVAKIIADHFTNLSAK
jgi:acetylornithine deacetylase/succinyl-diaminopimelate desuccinylase-like protein